MRQDFAKIKPEPLLQRQTVATPPAWSLMFTGVIVGMTIGVFGCFLFYLSGNVPTLNVDTAAQGNAVAVANSAATVQTSAATVQTPSEPVEKALQLQFYAALPAYEVTVDASPVELTVGQAENDESESERTYDPGFMLQTGAFQRIESANSESERQKILGLDVKIKQQQLLGRTLYLVQSGPYTSSTGLSQAEQILRANNIPSLRMSIQ